MQAWRKLATFFQGIVMVTSEMNHILHVANGGCVLKIFMVVAYVEDRITRCDTQWYMRPRKELASQAWRVIR